MCGRDNVRKLGVEMKGTEDRKRKRRSDRKRHINPTISVELYECLSRISYITSTPIKDVGEALCIESLKSKNVIDELSPFFRRDYHYVNDYGDINVIPGLNHRLPYKVNRGGGDRARVSMRFYQHNHDKIGDLAYALDMTISSATALLLEIAFDHRIGHKYIERVIKQEMLNPLQVHRFNKIVQFINLQNGEPEPITTADLFDYLSQQAYDQTIRVQVYLQEWIDQYKDHV